jgi:DNA replication protein DnaC
MLMKATMQKLNALGLYGMAIELESQLANTNSSNLSFEDRISILIDQEMLHRDNNRMRSLLRRAKLRESACMEDIEYSASRGVERSNIASLSLCHWIENATNIIITGSTGVGKTWIACALGNLSCRHGKSTLFIRLSTLLEELAIAKALKKLGKKITYFSRIDVLIIDDFGLVDVDMDGKNNLLEIIEARTGRGSTIITSQIPVENWHDYLSKSKNPTIADALLDRLLGNSFRINLKGDSMRKLKKK